MADDLMIEVAGSANKATSAIDKAIAKLTELQETFDKLAPSVAKFSQQMDSIASGSKAITSLKGVAAATDKQAIASANAESKMAMYQARLDRANVSMAKSQAQSEKLASALGKVSEAQEMMQANSTAFSMSPEEFVSKYSQTGKNSSVAEPDVYPEEPIGEAPKGAPTVNYDTSQIESEMDAITDRIGSKKVNVKVGVQGEEQAESSISRINSRIKDAISSIKKFGKESESASNKSTSAWANTARMMEKMFIRIAAFRIFSAASQGITTGIQDMAQASTQANSAMSALATSSLYLKNSLAAALMPAIEALTPYITSFANQLANLFNTLGMLFARIFGGATSVTVAKSAQVDYAKSIASTGDAAKKTAKEIQNSIMGFDELNTLTKQTNSASSNTSNKGMPSTSDMFTTEKIPDNILGIADKLSALKPFFDGLGKVIGSFWDTIKKFAQTYLYQWLVDIGNWMEKHPDVLYALGKGLGYVAIGLAAFKTLKWLADVTGITKLVSWLWNLHAASKAVKQAFDEKNQSLTQQTADTEGETEAVKELSPEMDTAATSATGLAGALAAIAMPALSWGAIGSPVFTPVVAPAIDLSAFNVSKALYLATIAAPAFLLAAAPAMVLTQFLSSKATYLAQISAPAIATVTAPAIVLEGFLSSKATYLEAIVAPIIQQAVAPAINLSSQFEPSIEKMKTDIANLSTSTQNTMTSLSTNLTTNLSKTWANVSSNTSQSLSGVQTSIKSWGSSVSTSFASIGTNIMTNMRSTFAYLPTAIAGGLNAAGVGISTWLSSVSSGFVSWGTNLVSNIGKTMSSWYSSFVGALASAWSQFTSFMGATGKKVSEWWSANKTWAAPVAIGLTAIVGTVAVVASGGTALAAVPALAALANGALVTGPTEALIGEGLDNEAVLPLNSDVFSQIAKGIRDNSSQTSGVDLSQLIASVAELKSAILDRPITLYANDRKIAESANRGNASISRRYSPIAAK